MSAAVSFRDNGSEQLVEECATVSHFRLTCVLGGREAARRVHSLPKVLVRNGLLDLRHVCIVIGLVYVLSWNSFELIGTADGWADM